MRVSSALCGGRRPGVLEALLAVVAGSMAEVQLVQTGQWLASVMAAGIAFSLLGTPLVDGLVSRASERAADAYAREVGVGRELARALVTVQGLDRHPPVSCRVERLVRPAAEVAVR